MHVHMNTWLTSLTTSMALCISIWMHVHDIKQRKHKINPNSNMWKANKQTNMWNRVLKPRIHEEGSKTKVYIWKMKQKHINKN